MIQKTEDYSIFKKHPSNRPIDDLNLKKIVNSIKMRNMLEIRPITVNQEMYIIDGQHRLEACKILQAPVFYIVQENAKDEDMIFLNNAQKTWSISDYIDFYASKGKKSYIQMKEIAYKNDISIPEVLIFFSHMNGKSYKSIKSGSYEKDISEYMIVIREKLSVISQIIAYLNEKLMGDKKFLKSVAIKRAFVYLFSIQLFQVDVFLKKLEMGLSRIHSCTKTKDYVEMFKSIYNFRNQEPIE